MTKLELINELNVEIELLKEKVDYIKTDLWSDDYDGDWGEGNESLGYYAGRLNALESMVVKLNAII